MPVELSWEEGVGGWGEGKCGGGAFWRLNSLSCFFFAPQSAITSVSQVVLDFNFLRLRVSVL